jgi:hypothetical protein
MNQMGLFNMAAIQSTRPGGGFTIGEGSVETPADISASQKAAINRRRNPYVRGSSATFAASNNEFHRGGKNLNSIFNATKGIGSAQTTTGADIMARRSQFMSLSEARHAETARKARPAAMAYASANQGQVPMDFMTGEKPRKRPKKVMGREAVEILDMSDQGGAGADRILEKSKHPMRKGPGGIPLPGDTMANQVKQGAKFHAKGGPSMASVAYGSANKASQAVLGTSIGKLALGAGLVVGALALVDSAIGRDPFSDAGKMAGGVQRFGTAMQQAQRPSYGQSAFQQSTQGLTFGLHNARTSF